MLLRNAYICWGNNNINSKTKNNTLKLFRSFINYVSNKFFEFATVFIFILFFKYLVIISFDIGLTSSLFDYVMFVTNIYVVSIWFGDKIYQLSTKADKVNLGFKTDYILHRSSPRSLLYLWLFGLAYYFVILPYFIPRIYYFLLEIGVMPRDVHATSPEPEDGPRPNRGFWQVIDYSQEGTSSSSGVNTSSSSGVNTVATAITPLGSGGLSYLINSTSFNRTPFYYKTGGGVAKPYYDGMCNTGPMALFGVDASNNLVSVRQVPHRPMPDVSGYFVFRFKSTGDRFNYLPYNPSHVAHKEKMLFALNSRGDYYETGITTPSNCTVLASNHQ